MRAPFLSIICSIAAALVATPFARTQSPPASAAVEATPAPRAPGMTRYKMTAGDLNGDGIAEAIVYDSDSKAIRVTDYSGQYPTQSMSREMTSEVTYMTAADLDADGRAELIVAQGLNGYNPKTGPQTDVLVHIFKPAAKGGWPEQEIYRKASERPTVTSLRVKDLDGDGTPEILFAYFASKYISELRAAKRAGDAWTLKDLPTIRMGTGVDTGDVMHTGKSMTVVGRPYGDPASPTELTAIGDAFVLDGDTRIPLPVVRGVSSIAVGNLDGRPGDEIVVADGWHSDYGKIARCRIAVVSRQGSEWTYELVEDLPDHMRFEQIDLVDLNGDQKPEIIGWASRNGILGGSVRVYERTGAKWRGMTIGPLAQTYAAGVFDSSGKTQVVFAGQPPMPVGLASGPPRWDATLGEAIATHAVDADTLVGHAAPALKVSEWVGSKPMTLAGFKGRVVMLDFWATWCKPCIEMYPEMRKWADEFGPQGFVILGVTNHSAQTSAMVREFAARQKLPWAVAIDPKNGTHMDYGVSPIPHTFLIDRQGIVRLTHVGGGDLTAIKAKVKGLLAER